MNNADTVVILSSELISHIVEAYFNSTMFKQAVEIVDLKPTETGYLFSVVFKDTALQASAHKQITEEQFTDMMRQRKMQQDIPEKRQRDRFAALQGMGPSVSDLMQVHSEDQEGE